MDVKEIKVFVSSTFKDLHEYRSYLVEHIYPKIEKLCWEKDIQFSYVDFRWGIPHSNINEITKMCLRQIGKCQPYFIGIVGDRYGSPFKKEEADFLKEDFPRIYQACLEKECISITEMEFEEGLFKNAGEVNKNSFCYKIADGYKSSGNSEENETIESIKRRNQFIEKIQNNGYNFKDFHTPEKLGELIYADFKEYLNSIPEHENLKFVTESKRKQKRIIYSKTKCYLPEYKIQNRLNEYLNFENKEINKPLFIYGPSGCGKSSLIAWNSDKIQNEDILVITHFVGFDGTSSERNIVDALLSEIKILDKQYVDTMNSHEALINWIINTTQKVVFLIDGINNASKNTSDLKFEWIPYELPENVRFVFTSIDDISLITLAKECNWDVAELPLFDKEKSKQLIQNYLGKVHNKDLNDNDYDAFIEENVKVIKFIDVENNDVKLKDGISEIIHAKNNITDIIRFYMGLKSTDLLFEKVLIRMEQVYPKDILQALLSALVASQAGLAEYEIINIVGMYENIISKHADLSNFIEVFLEEMDYYIVKRENKYSLFHASFEKAVFNRYESQINIIRRTFVLYYDTLQNKMNDCNELYYQLYILRDWETMHTNLKNFQKYSEFVFGVINSNHTRLIEGVHFFYDITELLLKHLNNEKDVNIKSRLVPNTLQILYELGEENGYIKSIDIIIPFLEETKIGKKALKNIFDKAISISKNKSSTQAFYYLSKYMKIVDNLYGGAKTQMLFFYKYYGDICISTIEESSLINPNGLINFKKFIPLYLIGIIIPSRWNLYEELILNQEAFSNKYAIKCREMFQGYIREQLNIDSSDFEVLYNHILHVYIKENRKGTLGGESYINLALGYLMKLEDNEVIIDVLLKAYEYCRKNKPFFNLDFGQICLSIGQHYLNNPGKNHEHVEIGFQYLYKAIIVFTKMKGTVNDKVMECLERILSSHSSWAEGAYKSGFILYVIKFYEKSCKMSNRKMKNYIFAKVIYGYVKNLSMPSIQEDIISYLQKLKVMPSFNYVIKKYNANCKRYIGYYISMSFVIVPMVFAIIVLYNIHNHHYDEWYIKVIKCISPDFFKEFDVTL